MLLPGQQEQQDALLKSGGTDWLVPLDRAPGQRFPADSPADQAMYDSGEGPRTWHLYRRN